MQKGSQSSSFLAINAKGDKVLSPKQNDRTTIFKKLCIFQIGIKISQNFTNVYFN
jgi:hypothetical protein